MARRRRLLDRKYPTDYWSMEQTVLDAIRDQPWFKAHIKRAVERWNVRHSFEVMGEVKAGKELLAEGETDRPGGVGPYRRLDFRINMHRKTKTRPRSYRLSEAQVIRMPYVSSDGTVKPMEITHIVYREVSLN